MKKTTFCLLLATLLAIVYSGSFAQQNQTAQKPNPEVEAIKKRISALQNQLLTMENEKLEVVAKLLDTQSKLADANARLANAEFGKLERELRDSNQKWLIGWIIFFLTVLAVVGTPLWLLLKSGVGRIITDLKSNADQLIADRVEESLDGFKDAVAQQEVIKNQLKVLEKEQAVSALENFFDRMFFTEYDLPEQIRALQEDVLLQVFCDETRFFGVRYKAAEVLAFKESPQLVSPVLELLNLVVDSDRYLDVPVTNHDLKPLVKFIGRIHTNETYQGLKKFLYRLLMEDPKHKNLFLSEVVFYLTVVSIELNMGDAVSILKSAMSHLQRPANFNLSILGEYFDSFNEPEGIKEILTYNAANEMTDVENRCLELLQKYDPDFVNEWRAQKEAANTETEEPS